MKRILLLFLWCNLIYTTGIGFAEQSIPKLDTIFEIQKYAEDVLNVKSSTLQSKNHLPLIKEILEKKCPRKAITEAQSIINQENPKREESLQWNPPKKLQYTFSTIKNLILQIQSDDPYIFCKNKYLSYSFLEKIRSKANTDYNIDSEYFTAKKPIMTSQSSVEIAEKTITIINNTSSLSGEELIFAQQTEKFAHEELKNLVNLHILTWNDLKVLDHKIEINYLSGCQKTHGSFHILQSKNTNAKKFKMLKLNIAICQASKYQENYRNYFKQILAHELGHYIYFFRDEHSQNFDKICRSNKKNTCNKDEFYSEYAQTNQEEDYAESFAYWYKALDQEKEFWSAPATEIIFRKESYFNKRLSS